jgi:hypothetical protein
VDTASSTRLVDEPIYMKVQDLAIKDHGG